MKLTIICCDICNKEGAHETSFFVGRFPGPAGSSEDHYEQMDLCLEHSRTALLMGLKLLRGDAKQLYEQLQQIPRKLPFK